MKKLIFSKRNDKEINNLFHPTGKIKAETVDFIKASGCFTKDNARFLPIFLKECFVLLKKGGMLEFSYSPELSGLKHREVEKILWWLFKKSYDIKSHNKKTKSFILRIEKIESTLKKQTGIDCWTFGMVTNGSRPEFAKQAIESIRKLKIPHYEIIICGYYPQHEGKNIKYIEFTQRDDLGWITKKKNIIAENAKYDNLCIFHDRMVFSKNWYGGMKKYGNNFEILSCPQKLTNNSRVGDWVSTNGSSKNPGFMYKIEELDYRDWDRWVYIGGQLMIMKKYIWDPQPWNETFYWGEGEDIEYSQRLTKSGYLSRFNPFSYCLSLSWNHGRLPQRWFPDEKNNTNRFSFYLTNVPARRVTRYSLYLITRIRIFQKIIESIFPVIKKTFVYKFITSH